jgi:hypothetical protein
MVDISANLEVDNASTLRIVVDLASSLAEGRSASYRDRAFSIEYGCRRAIRRCDAEGHLHALRAAAHTANKLAKDAVDEWHRALAYEIKDVCLSALVRNDRARVNNVTPDGLLGIDILISPPSRLHSFLSKLNPDAQMIVRSQLGIGPTDSPSPSTCRRIKSESLRRICTKRRLAV